MSKPQTPYLGDLGLSYVHEPKGEEGCSLCDMDLENVHLC